MPAPRHGFTLIELAASISTAGLALAAGSLITQPRQDAQKAKDSTHIRGIHQALIIWAQNNNDRYPLPSDFDKKDDTVKDKGRAKDTTANIFSMTVFNGSLSTEIYVSPVEKNPAIEVDQDYQFDGPRSAPKPAAALWDPAFAADFTGGKKGNISYAHLQPAGKRLPRWSNTFSGDEKVLSNRGPEIKSAEKRPDGSVKPVLANPASIALTLHGDGAAWSGWISSNDTSQDFQRGKLGQDKPAKPSRATTYKDKDGKEWPDLWFYDEPDDPDATNTYLGIFTKAGATPKEYKAIWD